MYKTKFLLPISAIIFLLTLSYSCNKENVLGRKSKLDSRSLADFENLPTVNNGILEFADQDHYNNWLEYVDGCVKSDSTTDDTITTEDLFYQVETAIGFNSLRKNLRDQFDILDQTGWATLDDIPVLHFIGDQTVLSTLNIYGEVKIGNNILNYLDKDHIVVIKNSSYLTDVRNFKNSAYTTAAQIFEIAGVTQGTDIELWDMDPFPFAKTGGGIPLGGELIKIDGTVRTNACNDREISIIDFRLQDLNTYIPSNFSIHWGDGSTSSSFAGAFLHQTHTYSASGNYTIRIYATPAPSSGFTGVYDWKIDVSLSPSCRKDSRNSGYVWKATSDLQRATRDYVSVTMQPGNLKRIYASTEAYQWQSNAWKTKKADQLRTEACMEVLNYNSCTWWYPHCDHNVNRNDRFVQAGFNVSQNFGWNVAYSNHDILHNSNWYNHNQFLNPCP